MAHSAARTGAVVSWWQRLTIHLAEAVVLNGVQLALLMARGAGAVQFLLDRRRMAAMRSLSCGVAAAVLWCGCGVDVVPFTCLISRCRTASAQTDR